MKKRLSTVRREFKNRDYTEEEVLVREATSNSEEMPSATLLDKIGKAMLRLPTYTDVFEMLWRRLCHLEYRRHVFKALCVLDHLMRVNPPNSTVQLALVVDTRDRWADISRLSALRLEALGSDTGQIRSLALRICQFVVEYEKSPNFAVNRERLRVKRKQAVIEPREHRPFEEAESKWTCVTCGFANLSRLNSCIMCEQAREGLASPHKSLPASPSPSSSQWWWACARCSFVNTRTGFTNTCEMCRNPRTVKIVGEGPVTPSRELKSPEFQKYYESPPPVRARQVWQCGWCSYNNIRLPSEPCEACSKTSGQVLAEAEHDAANSKVLQQKLREAASEQEAVEQLIRRLSQELVVAERKLKESQDLHRRLSQQEWETNEVRNACRKQAVEQAKQKEAFGNDIAQRIRMDQGRRDVGRNNKDLEEKDRRTPETRRQEYDRPFKQQEDGYKHTPSAPSLLSAPLASPLSMSASPKERNDLEAIKQAAKERIANLKQKQEATTWNCSFCHFSNPSSSSQCEVCKQTQSWQCSYCQTANPNTTSTCRTCNRDSGKVVMHYSSPPVDTQPKGWLCPYCRTVNNPSVEICKQCDYRNDLAPPAYHHSPPTTLKELHPPPAVTTLTTSHTPAPPTQTNFSVEHLPSLIPPTSYRVSASPSHPSPSVHYPSSPLSDHRPGFEATPAITTSSYSAIPSSSSSSSSASSNSFSSSFSSPPPHAVDERNGLFINKNNNNIQNDNNSNNTSYHYENEGMVGGIQRQMSALSSFDSFFDIEVEGSAPRPSFGEISDDNNDFGNNANINKYNSPDREPAVILEHLSNGANGNSNFKQTPITNNYRSSPPDRSPPERPPAKQDEPSREGSALWTCSQCAYINDRDKTMCEVCNHSKPKGSA